MKEKKKSIHRTIYIFDDLFDIPNYQSNAGAPEMFQPNTPDFCSENSASTVNSIAVFASIAG